MLSLHSRGIPLHLTTRIVGKVYNPITREGSVLLVKRDEQVKIPKYPQIEVILLEERLQNYLGDIDYPSVHDISLKHIAPGDILLIQTNGKVSSLFRENSEHNTLFITDRCNSNCLMCSQPPKNKDDLDYFWDINIELIKLIPKDTRQLGITGGEPTLLGERFISLLEQLTVQLPNTSVHILTNGRSFAWKEFCYRVSAVGNRNIVFGIPLYSDFETDHDFVVQAHAAFAQTMLGFYNLARYGQRIEVRVVIHKQTYTRLPSLAKYIFKNLPFVEHIAFMGLEYTGYTPLNDHLLWMEPKDYSSELEEAVNYLSGMGMEVSIYNLPHCLLPKSLWLYSRNSISDWKQQFLPECTKCSQIDACGGVFATSRKQSNDIKAFC